MQVTQPMKETSEKKHSQAFNNVKMLSLLLSQPPDTWESEDEMNSHGVDVKQSQSHDEPTKLSQGHQTACPGRELRSKGRLVGSWGSAQLSMQHRSEKKITDTLPLSQPRPNRHHC